MKTPNGGTETNDGDASNPGRQGGLEGTPLVVLAAGRARRYGGCKPLAPVGPSGEAVIDLLAADSIAAGFGTIVLVVGPETGPAIQYHVERTWPSWVDVRFELQDRPLGTVDAVVHGTEHLPPGQRFGVANADDLYGVEALSLLAEHVGSDAPEEALVAFRLENAIVGDAPVTRGVCAVDGDGMLVSVTERRQVMAVADGSFVAKDGLEPSDLDGATLVSMNLWGFTAPMRGLLAQAMASARDASEEAEVLLPELVGRQLASRLGPTSSATTRSTPHVRVLAASGRCIGVTHPDDLTLVQEELASAVANGERPAKPWPVAT